MALPPLLRAEYFDAALEKTSDEVELELLRELRDLARAVAQQQVWVEDQCIDNRLAAGENLKRVVTPQSAYAQAERAAADIHKLELRKCRRATEPREIIESMLELSKNDTEFMRPLLSKIDLPANRELSEKLLAQKEAFQQQLKLFLARTRNAT